MTRILMVVTGSDHLMLRDGTRKPTGFWAEEVVVPHQLFREAGAEVAVATPGGVEPPVDRGSLTPEMNRGEAEAVAHYRQYLAGESGLKHPLVLERLNEGPMSSYDAVFLPGGHGPMEDLAHSEALGRLLGWLDRAGKLIVAVCHGPAGLLPARAPDGAWLFRSYRLTGFTNEEEAQAGLADKVPFLLETRLRELRADFRAGPAWGPHVVVDRNLITGQNPASSAGVAREALAWLAATVVS